jgi:hypothetical protein
MTIKIETWQNNSRVILDGSLEEIQKFNKEFQGMYSVERLVELFKQTAPTPTEEFPEPTSLPPEHENFKPEPT